MIISVLLVTLFIHLSQTQDCPTTDIDSEWTGGFTINVVSGKTFTLEPTCGGKEFHVTTRNNAKIHVSIEPSRIFINGTGSNGVPITVNGSRRKCNVRQQHQDRNPCSPGNLPVGYTRTAGLGAHKLHSERTAWTDARNICKREGGHLAVINSNEEERLILRLINAAGHQSALLGLHALYPGRDWASVQDVNIANTGYAKWSPRITPNPDNYHGRQYCARLLNTGGMDDIECSSHLPFVCEISCTVCT